MKQQKKFKRSPFYYQFQFQTITTCVWKLNLTILEKIWNAQLLGRSLRANTSAYFPIKVPIKYQNCQWKLSQQGMVGFIWNHEATKEVRKTAILLPVPISKNHFLCLKVLFVCCKYRRFIVFSKPNHFRENWKRAVAGAICRANTSAYFRFQNFQNGLD